ncbi:MAG: hypothetical protein V2I37_10140 [Marinilabiliaceae bacterium]|jgi:hypothetical protein|nr:hypothetical protein [Marinilabiliaceae bacterium]
MKRVFYILIFLACSLNGFGQFKAVGFSVGAGYTAVNIEEAIDYSPLEEWDNFGIMIKANAEYNIKDKFIVVGEAGSNRLYYWEYYWNDGYYNGYRWGSEWTSNLSLHIKKYIRNKAFIQAGPGVHFFNNGTGVVPGLVFQIGNDIELTHNISLPLLFRVESVFGNSSPTSLLLGAGLSYSFTR